MKILSLDDHPLFSAGLEMSLSQFMESVEVISTFSHGEAFKILLEEQDIDLLLLDLKMPEIGGLFFML